jgi:hypothetical protein
VTQQAATQEAATPGVAIPEAKVADPEETKMPVGLIFKKSSY